MNNKTIINYIRGGLGNQLFHYACGYALSKKYNTEMVFDTNWFQAKHTPPRTFELNLLNIENKIENNITPEIQIRQRNIETNVISEFNIIKSNYDTFGLYGWWIGSSWFIDVIDEIKINIAIKNPIEIKSKHKKILEKIQNTNSVSVHIRRTDYLNYRNKKVCDLEYYNNSIKKIKQKIPNMHLFYFSDDIDWVKKNMRNDIPSTYMNKNTTIDDFYLMSQCNHNIIANSTFSWWAAFLNNNLNKIVIHTRLWNLDYPNRLISDEIPPDWRNYD